VDPTLLGGSPAVSRTSSSRPCGAKPVYASTDYIFDGSRGFWREDDEARPVMAYGRQKLAIEAYLRSIEAAWVAARLSKVVGGETDTHSLLGQWVGDIKAGREMRCARDQIFSPAWVVDVAEVLVKLACSGCNGLFNLAGPAAYSRLGLLQLLVDQIREIRPDIAPRIVPISLHEMPFLKKRPLDTSLDTSKLRTAVQHEFLAMPELCAMVAHAHFG
jgi:dTDP-4-dehydrorhamnose reductase